MASPFLRPRSTRDFQALAAAVASSLVHFEQKVIYCSLSLNSDSKGVECAHHCQILPQASLHHWKLLGGRPGGMFHVHAIQGPVTITMSINLMNKIKAKIAYCTGSVNMSLAHTIWSFWARNGFFFSMSSSHPSFGQVRISYYLSVARVPTPLKW